MEQEKLASSVAFNRPTLAGPELTYIADAINRRKIAGDGHYTALCNRWLESRLGAERALLTHSCTAALEMAALLLDIGPGDEVIMPSYTFVSTANAVVLRGGVPVFVDIDPATLNIAPIAIEAAASEKTKAIFAVHYAGVPCDMDAIDAIAAPRGIAVVEDAAQALGSTYNGRPAGALGALAAFSFHETKNIVSGEGGALIVNDPALAARAEIIREKGTDRSRFLRGQVDKYSWVDLGSSYLPSEIVAAFLYAQLEALEKITAERVVAWDAYHEAFAEIEEAGFVRRPRIPANVTHNGHIYQLLAADEEERDGLIAALGKKGISAAFHYVPLHSSPAGLKYGRAAGGLRVTDDAARRLVRLPLYPGIAADQARVIDALLEMFGRR